MKRKCRKKNSVGKKIAAFARDANAVNGFIILNFEAAIDGV